MYSAYISGWKVIDIKISTHVSGQKVLNIEKIEYLLLGKERYLTCTSG